MTLLPGSGDQRRTGVVVTCSSPEVVAISQLRYQDIAAVRCVDAVDDESPPSTPHHVWQSSEHALSPLPSRLFRRTHRGQAVQERNTRRMKIRGRILQTIIEGETSTPARTVSRPTTSRTEASRRRGALHFLRRVRLMVTHEKRDSSVSRRTVTRTVTAPFRDERTPSCLSACDEPHSRRRQRARARTQQRQRDLKENIA